MITKTNSLSDAVANSAESVGLRDSEIMQSVPFHQRSSNAVAGGHTFLNNYHIPKYCLGSANQVFPQSAKEVMPRPV